ncbi:hypothetical protein HK097_006684, partial [Rhizophlyctis rosea]
LYDPKVAVFLLESLETYRTIARSSPTPTTANILLQELETQTFETLALSPKILLQRGGKVKGSTISFQVYVSTILVHIQNHIISSSPSNTDLWWRALSSFLKPLLDWAHRKNEKQNNNSSSDTASIVSVESDNTIGTGLDGDREWGGVVKGVWKVLEEVEGVCVGVLREFCETVGKAGFVEIGEGDEEKEGKREEVVRRCFDVFGILIRWRKGREDVGMFFAFVL